MSSSQRCNVSKSPNKFGFISDTELILASTARDTLRSNTTSTERISFTAVALKVSKALALTRGGLFSSGVSGFSFWVSGFSSGVSGLSFLGLGLELWSLGL